MRRSLRATQEWLDLQHARAQSFAPSAKAATTAETLAFVQPPTTIDIPERDILSAVLDATKTHPRVAWAERMNSGAYSPGGGRYLRFGFPGLSDILGQLKDGRLLAIEVKRAGKQPTNVQIEFMGRVARWHGVAFVARSVDDAIAGIDAAYKPRAA